MVHAYWHVGREIVGSSRPAGNAPATGDEVIEQLSARLAAAYGRGFSVRNPLEHAAILPHVSGWFCSCQDLASILSASCRTASNATGGMYRTNSNRAPSPVVERACTRGASPRRLHQAQIPADAAAARVRLVRRGRHARPEREPSTCSRPHVLVFPNGRSGEHSRRGVRPTADHRIVLNSATWEHYELELAMRGDKSVPRLAYLNGALELMRSSRDHERLTSYLGRLIEVYAEHADIELSPYRSWTLKVGRTCGCEPDECYIIGADQSKERPDFIIDVIWTSGGIDKLAIYQRLGIDDVWFWVAGRLEVFTLRDRTYERGTSSRWLPGLDLDLMCTFLDRRSVHIAKRDYREALRHAM